VARLMLQRPLLRAVLDEEFIDGKTKGVVRAASGLARAPSASRRPTVPKLKFVDAFDGAHESQHETFADQPEGVCYPKFVRCDFHSLTPRSPLRQIDWYSFQEAKQLKTAD
jgi:hypothetical protein